MRTIKGYISGRDGRKVAPVEKKIVFERDVYRESKMINIFPERRYQEILGFGGAFTEASAYNYAQMDEETKKKVIRAYFDKDEGLGYNFCRTHIHSCDFSLNQYTYTEENDKELKTFSIDPDRVYTIPFIKDAIKAADGMRLFASPWSPPAWMKSSKTLIRGGRLLEEHYEDWANYLVRYFQEYEKEGIHFYAMTVQNEGAMAMTWESCVYTAEEESEFAVKYLRPALDAAGYQDIKIMIWDFNKEHLYDRARDSLQVPGAQEAVWGVAYHWYSGDHFDAMDMVHECYPDKPLLLTEAGRGGARGEKTKGAYGTWINAEMYASELIGDLNHHMAAATEWNLILDQDGGPYHDRDFGCKAPMIYDHEKRELSIRPEYYAIAHFSRFIKRGAVRLGTSTFCEDLKTVAVENPNGEIVLIILNCAEKDYEISIRLERDTAALSIPSKTISTYIIADQDN